MDFAKDRSGNIVRADDAMTGALGYYYCPVCKAEVFARQGDYYVHHFAHQSRRARPECELYYPSEGIKGPLPPSRYEPDEDREGPRPQLQLSLELEPEANQKVAQLQKWGLRLTVPKATRSHGQIQIDCGGVHRPKISLAKLSLGPQNYSIADPSVPEFRVVWFSPEVGPYYKESLSEPLPGLDRDRINIFVSSPQKLKPIARSLVYGSAYYFVWLRSAAIELPPQITSTALATNGYWSAVLAVLPTEADAQLREWLEAHCRIPASSDGRRWSIVYPPLHGFDPEGRILVKPSKQLFLNVLRPEDLDCEARIDFQLGKDGQASNWTDGPVIIS